MHPIKLNSFLLERIGIPFSRIGVISTFERFAEDALRIFYIGSAIRIDISEFTISADVDFVFVDISVFFNPSFSMALTRVVSPILPKIFCMEGQFLILPSVSMEILRLRHELNLKDSV